MNLETLFENFVKERIYLKNVSPKTVLWYRASFKYFERHRQGRELTKENLNATVVEMRSRGISAESVNVYMRAVNSFLSWLHENEHTPEHLRIKQIKTEKKLVPTYKEAELRLLLGWKPQGFYEHRLYALIALLIDTGIRIEEAITLKTEKVDLENLLITVTGKGNKERIIPISYELRKILFRWSKQHKHRFFLPTHDGAKVGYNNFRRDFNKLCEKLGIEDMKGTFHVLRHTFAYNHVRNGGNLFALQKMLGHETLQMTRRYCELQTEDLQNIHQKTSILGKLR